MKKEVNIGKIWQHSLRLYVFLLFALANLGTIWAGNPVRQIYYLPITEEEAHLHYAELNLTPGYDDYIVNVISITPSASNTVIYYDHWEDGFESDLANPVQATTQIWGDNNPANGIPPGFATDIIGAGQALIIVDTNSRPHIVGSIFYDGGDKMGASKPISVSMVLWPVFHDDTGDGVDLAEGISVLDTTRFGTEFYAPLGTDLLPANMFESVRINIMASQDNTVVSVDRDGNGTVDITKTLAEGEGWSDGSILAGGKVTATHPVQAHLMTGDIDAKYANRWATLYPTSLWSDDYYSPVGLVNASSPVYVYLFNKEATPLTVTYLTTSAYGTFNVPAKGGYRHTVASDTATRFYAADGTPFQAVTTIDTGTAYDWSASLIPGRLLSTVTSVSFGPGSEDGTANGSPIWVTAIRPTTIYVDYDGNPATGPQTDSQGNKYNVSYTVAALQSTRVRDPDNNQTGMRLYTLDGVDIFSMWGEDPSVAAGGRPYIDAGTAIIPVSGVMIGDYIWIDRNGDGVQSSNEHGIPGVQVQVYTSGGVPFTPRQKVGTFEDNFEPFVSPGLSGNDGTLAWANAWIAANSAAVVVNTGSDYEIRIHDDNNSSMTRSFVVPTGTDQLTIKFDYRQGAGDDTVKAQFYNGTAWSDLATFITGTSGTGSASYIVPTTPGTRQIRFIKTAGGGSPNNEYIYFDNISIIAETVPTPLTNTTDVNGYYAFDPNSGLVPGTAYQLRVATNQTALAGFMLTGQDLGGNNTTDSDASLTTAVGFATIAFTAPPLLGVDSTLDFGFLRPGIGDFVWNDTNFNGQQDVGEPGISGVTVNLYRPGYGPDGIAGTGDDADVVATQITDAGGFYRFINLPAGDYVVEFTPMANFVRTTANSGSNVTDSNADATTGLTATITLSDGQAITTIDAGYYIPPPALGDFVWFDENGNGQQDGGETGLNGVPVSLYRPGFGPDGIPGNGDDNAVVATTTTAGVGAGAGFYSFTGIATGGYEVVFGALDGYHRSPAKQGADATDSDADPITGRTALVTVLAGQVVKTVDAGYNNLGIGDFIWQDRNANGVQDAGEPGLTGVVVRVYTAAGAPYQVRSKLGNFADDFDPSGGLNGNDGSLTWASNWTAANSAAVVINTAPDYELRIADNANSSLTRSFVAPAGTGRLTISYDYRQSGDGDDTVKAQWSENGTTWLDLASYITGSAGSGIASFTVATTAGTRYLRFVKTAQGSGGGTSEYMFFDKVNILAESALTDLTMATGSWGYYSFGAGDELLAGTAYQLRVATNQAALAGLVLTPQNQGGDDAKDSDATLATAAGFATIAFTSPAAGGSNQTFDFGFRGTAAIGDRVWNDLNGDGVQSVGENNQAGVSNIVVRLLDAFNVVVAQTITDVNGAYLFDNLPPANYQLEFVPSAAYLFTTPDASTATDATDSDAAPATGRSPLIALAAGETNLTVDAGVYLPARLYGYVFKDKNTDLLRNSGDTPITNALVTLTISGITVATTNTDAVGYYFFGDIPVGAATILVSQANSTLVAVPATTDETRNRAVASTGDTAMIVYPVISGYGVLAALPGEQLNFGYSEHPLSTQLDVRVYTAADGRVMIEISTVNENGNQGMEAYALINGEWTLVATVPADQIVGFGSNTYTVEAFGLSPGASYRFQIVDESGHIFESELIQVAHTQVAVKALTLTPEMIKLLFNTEPGTAYQVMVCEALGAPWKLEYVQLQSARGLSELSNEPFTAGHGEKTEVLVPRNRRAQAFFKIIEVQ